MDALLRGINKAQDIRVVSAVTTELTREACRRHGLTGAAAMVLGRAMTAGCLLATLTKKDDERVRIKIRGDGPLGHVLVDAHSDGTARGCIEHAKPAPALPASEGGRVSLAQVVGASGQILVTRDVGLAQEYQGVVEIRDGEIDSDLERYLTDSEQLPSVLACETKLDSRGQILRSAGLLCQTFPGADADVLESVRTSIKAGGLADLLRQDRTPQEVSGFAFGGDTFQAMQHRELSFKCTCGRDRALYVLSTLGSDDLDKLASEQGETDVTCSFCSESYTVPREDLVELAARLRKERS